MRKQVVLQQEQPHLQLCKWNGYQTWYIPERIKQTSSNSSYKWRISWLGLSDVNMVNTKLFFNQRNHNLKSLPCQSRVKTIQIYQQNNWHSVEIENIIKVSMLCHNSENKSYFFTSEYNKFLWAFLFFWNFPYKVTHFSALGLKPKTNGV